MTLSLVCLVAAFICFVIAALGVPTGKVSILASGLALWVLAELLAGHLIR